jgi:hypothetical protein
MLSLKRSFVVASGSLEGGLGRPGLTASTRPSDKQIIIK